MEKETKANRVHYNYDAVYTECEAAWRETSNSRQ